MFRTLLLTAACSVIFAKRVDKNFQEKVDLKTEENVEAKGNICEVKWLNSVCDCDASTGFFTKAYQCSGCKDTKKWGYGCDLDCPEKCTGGCDFTGNCKNGDWKDAASHCKAKKDDDGQLNTYNENGDCIACEDDSYGVVCEKRCKDISDNCEATDEGECTRDGKCYKCKAGFYGETCDKKCAGGCSACVQVDNVYKEDDMDEFMEAGHCLDKCKGNTWGPTCEEPCPDNCKIRNSGGATCDKVEGYCVKCGAQKELNRSQQHSHQWWGDKCDKKCSDGCVDTACEKANGRCEKGIVEGFCGSKGDKRCPEHTIGGCEKITCKPEACEDGWYPGSSDCVACPSNCDGICDYQGVCPKCKTGFWGQRCDKECGGGCDGGCSQAHGTCDKCKTGLTGGECSTKCHASCETCDQYGGVLNTKPGSGKSDCASCPEEHPSELESGYCSCIKGATISEDTEVCDCDDKAGFQGYFISKPAKECRQTCESGFRDAYIEAANGGGEMACFPKPVANAVAFLSVSGHKFEQGSCEDGFLEISGKDLKDPVPEEYKCMKKGFVDYYAL